MVSSKQLRQKNNSEGNRKQKQKGFLVNGTASKVYRKSYQRTNSLTVMVNNSTNTNSHNANTVFWKNDVVALTGYIIKFVESHIDGPVLKQFHQGNDQINYGYTDKGLNQTNSKDKINFSELGTQLAYIYRFFASHVLIMGELLLSSSGWAGIRYPASKPPLVQNLGEMNRFIDSISSTHVAVTCFGGGPVSEVAAITAWLRTEGITEPILFNIVDKYSAWKYVAMEVSRFCNVELHYKELDFLTSHSEELLPYVSTMDIVCMSKFLSALTAHRGAATRSLRYVLQNMRRGAILVYIDNSGGGTTQWLTGEAIKADFYEVFTVPHFPARLNPAVLAPNERRSLFNVKATSTLNVAFKVFKKGRDVCSGLPSAYCRSKFYHRIGDSCTSC